MAEWSNAAVLKTVEGHTSGGSNPSLSANSKGLFFNPLLVFTRFGFGEVGTKWELDQMKPYRKPSIVDHDGDLSKQWYVYFRYWDDETNSLAKARRSKFPDGTSPNRIKDRKERTKQIGLLRDAIEYLLQRGWTPKNPIADSDIAPKTSQPEKKVLTIDLAVKEVLRIKSEYLSKFGLRGFQSKANAFRDYLEENGMANWPVDKIQRKHITEFLRHVKKTKGKSGEEASPRTRNNYLNELHGIFEKMKEEDMLLRNPCKGISSLRESVTRHISFSTEQMALIGEWMDENDPYLKMFSSFIGYAFLRPIEIMRLKVKNIKGNEIYFNAEDAKTATSEVIPIIDRLRPIVQQLISEASSPEDYLFTTSQKPGPKQVYSTWYFSKRFQKCKEYMNSEHNCGFTDDNTLYAMRHTFIRDIYLHFRKTMTKEQAEFATMPITRHKTLEALRAYIRDYSIELPDDWSDSYSIKY